MIITINWYNTRNHQIIFREQLNEESIPTIYTATECEIEIRIHNIITRLHFSDNESPALRQQIIRENIQENIRRLQHQQSPYPELDSFIPLNDITMPTRATNREWLLAESKDILKKYNNPVINWIDVSPAHTDQPEEYKNYGINIVVLNRVKKAQNVPGELGDWYRNYIEYKERELINNTFQIPETRNEINFTGYITQYRSSGWAPEFNGLIINLNNRNLAFLKDNTVILLWELEERNTANKHIMRYLLKEVLANIDQAIHQPNEPENQEEYAFSINIIKFLSGKSHALRSELAQAEGNAEGSYQNYIEQTKRIQKLKLDIINQEAEIKNIDIKVKKAITYFKNHKNVLKFENANTKLIIWLKDLSVTFKKETIKLPIIKTEVDLQSAKFKATVDDPSVKYIRCHPHIFGPSHGYSACAGNYTTIFPRIVANGDITGILELLIQFFESYNDESPAINWIYWRYIIKNNLDVTETGQLSETQIQTARQEWTDYLDKHK